MYSKFGHHPHPLGYFVSVVPSIAELAHGKKSHSQLPSLFNAPGTKACALEKYTFNMHQVSKQIIVQPNGWLNLPQSTTLPLSVTAKHRVIKFQEISLSKG